MEEKERLARCGGPAKKKGRDMKVKPASKPGNVLVEMKPLDDKLFASSAVQDTPFKISTILVPIDFSPLSRKALQYAVPFARKHEARIVLVHVVEPVYYPESYLATLPPEIEDVNIERARSAKQQLAELRKDDIGSEIPADVLVETGRPWNEIINVAKDENVDLIVIATHGHSGLKHVFLGSTAERVVRHAPCPILVVRENEREFVHDESA